VYPKADDQVRALGEAAFKLLGSVDGWVTRRKESVTVIDETLVRRHMSVDFELPAWLEATHRSRGDEPVYYAPLFMLQKGSDDLPPPSRVLVEPPPHFAGFDLRNSHNESLSLPPREWNADVSIEALRCAVKAAAERASRTITVGDWDVVDRLLRHICRTERNEAVRMLEQVKYERYTFPDNFEWLRRLVNGDPELDWLLAACAKSSITMVPLIGAESRHDILKLSFNEQIARFTVPSPRALRERRAQKTLAKLVGSRLGWAGYEFWIDTPFISAGTYHVEVEAPTGLEIYDAGLLAVEESPDTTGAKDPAVTLSRVSGCNSEVHLYASDAGSQHGALTWVRLRGRRSDFLLTAVVVAVLIAVILWTNSHFASQIKTSSRGVPELLLLFPGAVAAYIARPMAHRLTTRMLGFARAVLLGVSATPYVAAASLAFSKHNARGEIIADSFRPWLHWLAVAATAGAAVLVIAYVLPQPEIRVQRAAKRAGWPALKRTWRRAKSFRPKNPLGRMRPRR